MNRTEFQWLCDRVTKLESEVKRLKEVYANIEAHHQSN